MIEDGNYFSAAATLAFAAGISVNPVTIGLFVLLCGGTPVE
ncbi:hypothetical protein [Tenuibacillus multivorans]|nr:hypothetical protein [Tenuibacillus multivorans]GEL77654.1 hypothetical protein TMU01_18890 [Tenuibacillus multivorans]